MLLVEREHDFWSERCTGRGRDVYRAERMAQYTERSVAASQRKYVCKMQMVTWVTSDIGINNNRLHFAVCRLYNALQNRSIQHRRRHHHVRKNAAQKENDFFRCLTRIKRTNYTESSREREIACWLCETFAGPILKPKSSQQSLAL